MNLSQGTTGGLICSPTSRNTYLVVNSARLLNMTNKEDEIYYIQMKLSQTLFSLYLHN